MVAYTPIPPCRANEIVDQAQIEAAFEALASFAEAGIVKAYARFTETIHADGRREEVRDKRIPRELWRRIVAEGRAMDVSSGTVRLQGSTEFGGGPKVTLIGIGFDDASVRDFAARHGTTPPGSPTTSAVSQPLRPAQTATAAVPLLPELPQVAPTANSEAASPSGSVQTVNPTPIIMLGAKALTIDQAVAALNIGRTTIYALAKAGDLTITKVGKRSIISVDEINRILGKKDDGQ